MKKLLLTSLIFTSTSLLASPFVIKEIQVSGVSPSLQKEIISQLPVRVGQRVTDENVANVVRTLFLRGSYDDVQARQKDNTLVIELIQRPIIADISFEGNSAIPTEALRSNLLQSGIVDGEFLDRTKLEAFRQDLVNHYSALGRYNAQIETVITSLPNNRANVLFKFNESETSLVKQTRFVGNEIFSDDRLLDVMSIQPDVSWWNIFASSRFEQERFGRDLDNLKGFYLNRGYAKFNILSTDVRFSPDKKDVYLTLALDEGEQYNVRGARIIGDTAGLSAELQPLLEEIDVGKQFRGEPVFKIENDIKSTLGKYGYGEAKVNSNFNFDEANKTVDISFVVDAGRRYTVRQIMFEGNDVSRDSTLRQEMRQQEGTWLSLTNVNLGKIRLDRTGFFETVDVRTEPFPGSEDELDVIYKVQERNTGSFNIGLSYGNEGGVGYQASVTQDNFLGLGSSLGLAATLNDYGPTINLNYTEPYFTKDGVSLSGDLTYETYRNNREDSSATYKRTTYGIAGTLGFPVNENNSYYLGLGYYFNKIDRVTPEYTRALYINSLSGGENQWGFRANDFEFSYGWNFNSLNRGFFPTEGTIANLGGKVTVPGSDNRYYKFNLNLSSYIPLNYEHSWVFLGKTTWGYANGIGKRRLPFYQNYTAGGIGSIRGFDVNSLGPHAIYANDQNLPFVSLNPNDYNGGNNINFDVVGGNAIGIVTTELIIPTPFVSATNSNSVRTSLFADAASIWNTKWNSQNRRDFANVPRIENYNDPGRVRVSVGVSFQWQSPLGLLVFSYARPVKRYEGDNLEPFQFNIGGTF